MLIIYRSGIRASRTRPRVAQDGGLLRLVELQVAVVECIQLLLAQSRAGISPLGRWPAPISRCPSSCAIRVTHQLVGSRDGIEKRQFANCAALNVRHVTLQGMTFRCARFAIVLLVAPGGWAQDIARMEQVIQSYTANQRFMGTVLEIGRAHV